jgi:hypothetical protein
MLQLFSLNTDMDGQVMVGVTGVGPVERYTKVRRPGNIVIPTRCPASKALIILPLHPEAPVRALVLLCEIEAGLGGIIVRRQWDSKYQQSAFGISLDLPASLPENYSNYNICI